MDSLQRPFRLKGVKVATGVDLDPDTGISGGLVFSSVKLNRICLCHYTKFGVLVKYNYDKI